MAEHAVVVAGGGPTGLMLASELALAGVDVAIVERRANQDVDGSRAGGLGERNIGNGRRVDLALSRSTFQ
jgi:3-(3-hydroxy-phenyl)propionate hydroxylase